MPPVVRIVERNLDDVFQRAPYVLVRLDRVAGAGFHPGVSEYFDFRYPRLFAFGTFGRTEWSDERVRALFQSSLGALRRGVGNGYYLFTGGFVVGYHGPIFRPTNVSYDDPEELASRERVAGTPGHAGLKPVEREQVRQLAAYFDPIVERKQRGFGFTDDGNVRAQREAAPPPPPPPPTPSAPTPDDPYVVLGIPPTATDDEVRTAYKSQLKLNHPDKVAHLSPALQQFAQKQTLMLKHAYASIVTRRGWPT